MSFEVPVEPESQTEIFLSRNWGGDHYVLTFVPPLPWDVHRSLKRDLEDFSGLTPWGIIPDTDNSRLTRHNDLGGDEGLKRMAIFACETLVQKYEIDSRVVNLDKIPRTQDGIYEEQE